VLAWGCRYGCGAATMRSSPSIGPEPDPIWANPLHHLEHPGVHEGRRQAGKHSSALATMPGACSGGREALWHQRRKACCAQKHLGGHKHFNVEHSRADLVIISGRQASPATMVLLEKRPRDLGPLHDYRVFSLTLSSAQMPRCTNGTPPGHCPAAVLRCRFSLLLRHSPAAVGCSQADDVTL
jgi:hypothetical protein